MTYCPRHRVTFSFNCSFAVLIAQNAPKHAISIGKIHSALIRPTPTGQGTPLPTPNPVLSTCSTPLLDLAIIGAPLLLYDDAEDVDYNPMSKIFNDDFMTSNETA